MEPLSVDNLKMSRCRHHEYMGSCLFCGYIAGLTRKEFQAIPEWKIGGYLVSRAPIPCLKHIDGERRHRQISEVYYLEWSDEYMRSTRQCLPSDRRGMLIGAIA